MIKRNLNLLKNKNTRKDNSHVSSNTLLINYSLMNFNNLCKRNLKSFNTSNKTLFSLQRKGISNSSIENVKITSKFDVSSRVKPANVSKNFSLPRNLHELYDDLPFPLQLDDSFISRVWKNVGSGSNTHFITKGGSLKPLATICLLLPYPKHNMFVIVDNDAAAEQILNLVTTTIKESAVYIKDASEFNLIHINSIRTIYVLNYKSLSKSDCNWTAQLEQTHKTFYFFYNLEMNELLFSWLKKTSVKEIFANKLNYFFTLQKDNKNLNKFDNHFTKSFYTLTFGESDADYNRVLNCVSYGMATSKEQRSIVAAECVRKYLKLNKKVAVVCSNINEKEKIIKHLENFKINLNTNNENLSFFIQNEKIEKNPIFEVLIESGYANFELHAERKHLLIKNSEWEANVVISLFSEKDLREISQIRQDDLVKFKIRNLLSSSFLCEQEINEHTNVSEISKENQSEFINKLQNFVISKSESQNKSFDSYYEVIKRNPALLKLICKVFFEQNSKELLTNETEDISLINGEPGFTTVNLIPTSTKQLEERYYIMKFLIRLGLTDSSNYENKVFRVFNSFDFVFDVPTHKMEDLRKAAKLNNIQLKMVTDLPIIFHHQFSEMLNTKRN